MEYGGKGVPTIWNEQGIKRVILLLNHTRAKDIVDASIRISLTDAQLEIGTDTTILTEDYARYGCLATETWISNCWEWLHDNNLKIHIPDLWVPRRQRHNDKFLMEIATHHIRGADLQKIQRCRLHLKAITLSDVADGTGQYLLPEVWKGRRRRERSTRLNFPNQEKPSSQDWTVFRRFLRLLLINPDDRRHTQTLPLHLLRLRTQYALGPWFPGYTDDWETKYSPTTNKLYVSTTQQMEAYQRGRRLQFQRHSREIVDSIPEDALPITLTSELQCTGIPTATVLPRQTDSFQTYPQLPRQRPPRQRFMHGSIPETIRTKLRQLPEWQQHYVDHLQLCPNFETKYRTAMERNKLRTASDGSAPFHGSFSWLLADRDTEEILASGGGECHHFEGLTSHRMETAGRLGRDIFISVLPRYRPTSTTGGSRVIHYCDNEESVNRSEEPDRRHTTNHTLHDFDLHRAIRDFRPLIPATGARWVKGHQDRDKPIEELPLGARLNIKADALAESYRSRSPPFLPPPPVPQIHKDNTPVTSNLTDSSDFTAASRH